MKPVSDPAILTALNGGQARGPRPVSDPAILAQLNGQASQAAPDGGIMDELRGIYTGLHRIPQSIVELGLRGTDAIGLTKDRYKMAHEVFTKDNASYMGPSQAAKVGDVLGQIAGTAPVAALKIPGLAARAPGAITTLGNIAQGALQGGTASALTSSASDAPLMQQVGIGAAVGGALPALGAAWRGGKSLVKGVIGETTGAGAQSLSNAYAAGKAGGEAADTFKANMRGDVSWDQVVDDAKAALGKLKQERSAAYKSGMVDISKDATVLDFGPVDDALQSSIKTFKGRDISTKTADIRKEIGDVIAEWRALDPAEYHTAEGFDALKQQVGEIKDSLPFGSPSRTYAEGVYNSLRNTIAKQAPAYNKVMKGYTEASEEISAIERELSLGKRVNPNTALRKLQSVLRDNANTSWGKRADYAARLEGVGAKNLMPALAGQALATPVPRGLAKYADALAVLNRPSLSLALPFASPRFMGETAFAAGRGAGLFGQIPSPVPSASMVNLPALLGVLGPQVLNPAAQQ